MIGVKTSVTKRSDTQGAVIEGTNAALMDSADKGFEVSQERVPKDRGTLMQSGIPPSVQDGDIVWGYNAKHARPIEHGTRPFTPPIQPLLDWGRRVLGSEGDGAAVWNKIREEGIDAQPFVQPGIDAMRAHMSANGIWARIEERL